MFKVGFAGYLDVLSADERFLDCELERIALNAVSYTHLDVYKRQVIPGWYTSGILLYARACKAADRRKSSISNGVFTLRASRIIAVPSTTWRLYTSRCV